MKTTSTIDIRDELEQIGITFLTKRFKPNKSEFQSTVSLGMTQDNKLITAIVTTDEDGRLLWTNIVETRM